MTKRAYVVMGAVSSGTRMLTRLLMAQGCSGDGDHWQRWDEQPPEGDLIVFRRHVPTRRRPPWAQHPNAITALQMLGYDVHAVIIVRDWFATIESAQARHWPERAETYRQNREIWRLMFRDLPEGVPFTVVTYESLVQRPAQALAALYREIGLEQIAPVEAIYDGNAKYYEVVTA